MPLKAQWPALHTHCPLSHEVAPRLESQPKISQVPPVFVEQWPGAGTQAPFTEHQPSGQKHLKPLSIQHSAGPRDLEQLMILHVPEVSPEQELLLCAGAWCAGAWCAGA